MEQKTVGIIGGLGPLATIEFMKSVLHKTPIAAESDHLHMIIDSNPKVPDINAAALGTGPTPVAVLQETARRLERSGAEFLVMICNAAHLFEREIQEAVSIPFVSMIKETVKAIEMGSPNIRTIGILATDGCLKARLYQNELAARGLTPVVLMDSQLRSFMQAVGRVKSGDMGGGSRDSLLSSVKQIVDAGAQAVVLGCSEISLVIHPDEGGVPFINPSDILADATVRLALANAS